MLNKVLSVSKYFVFNKNEISVVWIHRTQSFCQWKMGESTDELINGKSNWYLFMYMLRSLPGLVGRVKSKVFNPKGLIKRHIKERGVLHLKINQAWGEMPLRLNIGLKLLPLWSGFTFVVVEWISRLIEVIEGCNNTQFGVDLPFVS